ncbi:MAG: phosphatase PAP2 family protein [Phycisphaerales bacterium]|nr:phosphatase PAP2 family protein [Phycisphaerales bacterium]
MSSTNAAAPPPAGAGTAPSPPARPAGAATPGRERLVAHPLAWLGVFIIASGWDRAAWLFVKTRTMPVTERWEAQGAFGSVGSAIYHAVKHCGTVWLPAAVAAAIILRSFVQPDTTRVRRAIRVGTLLFFCPAAAGLAAEALKLVLRRQRPELSDGWYVFRFADFWNGSGLGLPSSHAAPAAAFALALITVWPRWWALFALGAVLCGVSRVLAGAHFPSDVAAGAFVGLLLGRVVIRLDLRNNRGRPLAAA